MVAAKRARHVLASRPVRRRLWRLSTLALAAGLAVPATLSCAPQVQQSELPAFDFSSSRTYAWITDDLILIEFGDPQPRVRTKSNETRVRDAIDRGLAAKGYTKVDAAEADLLIAFSVGTRMRYRVEGVSLGDQPGTPQTKGTLNIYALDRGTGREVWHAYLSKWLSKNDDPATVIDEAVRRILTEFPTAAPATDATG